MKDHLTADQVDRYRHRSLAPGELLALDDHLAGCEECRGRLLDGIRLKHPALPDCVTHLTYEQVAAYIDHDLDDIDVEILHSHVELCRQCEEEVRNLDQFRRDFSRSPIPQPAPKARSFLGDSVRRRLRLGVLIPAAAAVTVAALAVIVLWPNRRPERVLLALNDGGGRITLTASGTVRGVEGLPKAYRDPIREALQSQQFQPSAELSSLISRGGVLRGSGRGESFPLLTPNATMVESDRPQFRWGPVPGADYYVVRVFDADYRMVTASPRLPQSDWTSESPIPRGIRLVWQVTAHKQGRSILSPAPDAPEVSFEVLGNARAAELAQARESYADSHLLLGVLYRDAGVLDEAEAEFAALATANPSSEEARQLLENVRAVRRLGVP